MGVRRTTCAVAGLLALLVAAPAADAASVRVTGGKVRYVGGGEANRVDVWRGPAGSFGVGDPRAEVRVGAGCRSTGRHSALCTGAISGVTVVGNSGADRLAAPSLDVRAVLDGGDGHDTLIGSGADDVLDGDDGNDRLAGAGGRDDLRGDNGADRLSGGAGPDVIDGGRGFDTADYSDAAGPLSIDLDGNADDGHPHEGDRVERDIDRVIGGPFGDRLAAITGAHTLVGGPGDDTLAGGSGSERLFGESGDDRLNGGVGSDVLNGGDGIDTADYAGRFDPVDLNLRAGVAVTIRGSGSRRVRETDTLAGFESARGSSHPDVLRGGPGANVLTGGRGNDVLDGDIEGDLLIGGSGRDRVDYGLRRAPVAVTIDGLADDGHEGEGDLVHVSVEDVAGGVRGDRLTGSSRRNRLSGRGGRDVLVGLGGGDRLHGGDGADRLDGGDGSDVLFGGAGLDLFLGGAGSDRASARDRRRDGVECGDGRDRVTGDRRDRIAGDCESKRR